MISQEFKNAIQAKNVRLVRIMLKDSLVIDPTFKDFDEMINLANQRLEYLYDKHDGENFEYDKNNWDKVYMDKQMIKLILNFSKERIDLLKKICSFFYSKNTQKRENASEATYTRITLSKKKAGAGCLAGGLVVSFVGAIVSKPIILATGLVASVVGGVLIITDKLGE